VFRPPIAGSADGHDLAVVALNPNCPDDLLSATFGNVARLAEANRARTLTVVNVVPRRSNKPDDLDLGEIPEARWRLNRELVSRVLDDASAIVLAWGVSAEKLHHRVCEEIAWVRSQVVARVESEQCIAYQTKHPAIWVMQGATLVPLNRG
jgi:hypothetical protein